jgi:hypothetical protein
MAAKVYFSKNTNIHIVSSAREVPYGAKHSQSMLGEARARAPVRASPSMLCECLAPYGNSLAELTIDQNVLL